MGELVDLKEYRLKKEAEEKIKVEEDLARLRAELAEITARLSLSPDLNSYPIFPEEEYYHSLSSKDFYFSTIWPPYDEYRKDVRDDDDLYSTTWTFETPKWCTDLYVYEVELPPRED